ncbi:hypothetical protein [Stenotrophomonas pavanii]|uniref:hypothetical protein n=1 Tax=Stenotrophomonas pavanii TaxID=487698 RepID=UPI0039C5D392
MTNDADDALRTRSLREVGVLEAGANCAYCAGGESHVGRGSQEIRLLNIYEKNGELQPLLEHFERYGLGLPQARKLLADLARRAPRTKRGAVRTRKAEDRDFRISVLVANRMGLLVRRGLSEKGAFHEVAAILQLCGAGLTERQVKRIWTTMYAELPFIFQGIYHSAREDGFEHPVYPDMK